MRLYKTCRTGFVQFNSPSQHKTHHIVNSTLKFPIRNLELNFDGICNACIGNSHKGIRNDTHGECKKETFFSQIDFM